MSTDDDDAFGDLYNSDVVRSRPSGVIWVNTTIPGVPFWTLGPHHADNLLAAALALLAPRPSRFIVAVRRVRFLRPRRILVCECYGDSRIAYERAAELDAWVADGRFDNHARIERTQIRNAMRKVLDRKSGVTYLDEI